MQNIFEMGFDIIQRDSLSTALAQEMLKGKGVSEHELEHHLKDLHHSHHDSHELVDLDLYHKDKHHHHSNWDNQDYQAHPYTTSESHNLPIHIDPYELRDLGHLNREGVDEYQALEKYIRKEVTGQPATKHTVDSLSKSTLGGYDVDSLIVDPT